MFFGKTKTFPNIVIKKSSISQQFDNTSILLSKNSWEYLVQNIKCLTA